MTKETPERIRQLQAMKAEFVARLRSIYQCQTQEDLLESLQAPLEAGYSITGHTLRQGVRMDVLVERGITPEEIYDAM